MPLNFTRARPLLQSGHLARLFREELGWEPSTQKLSLRVEGKDFSFAAFAEKRGFIAWMCECADGPLPLHATRLKIDRALTETSFEHLIVFTTLLRDRQSWMWVRREAGKPSAPRTHEYFRDQPGESLLQKLDALHISFEDEEAGIDIAQVAGRARAAFDVERVTRRFYREFDTHRKAFVKFIEGIEVVADREWYASVMLNRLMFVYFIQRKGFLADDRDYLRNRLARCQREHGRDKFYSFYRFFLLRLFHEGFGRRRPERSADFENLLGSIPYLNGGLFDEHELERPERYGKKIEIADKAFERVFAYFDQYQWHLDERPLRKDDEINPDVLGYIFEKYINQKQMGAYYTKEDITDYIGKNTLLPFLLDAARAKCKVAFKNPGGPTVWDLLRDNPDRYIYAPVKHGVSWDIYANEGRGAPLETPRALPSEIEKGIDPATPNLLERRAGWNRAAPVEFALPTETWREVVARRQRCTELRRKLAAGEVREVGELITLNLDIRQFVQDVIAQCEGPDLLRAFWHALEKVTVLDPTCGSGAFLFAALNLLEPLYEACLDRMEAFLGDLDRSGEKHRPEKFGDFRETRRRVEAHPNRRYFVFKSIILQNLYGVDIMEEAVEICKLRLFLKLAAQVSPDPTKENLGIEPLPDIDFNVRAGNTLVGFATYAEVERAVTSTLDFDHAMEKISTRAADLQQASDAFRQRQTEGDGSVPAAHKQELQKRLTALRDELNRYLASDYGVDGKDKVAFAKWVTSHQPFHWFVEFYGILKAGGFDVVIGNPPYVEYSRSDVEYRLLGYATSTCDNLWAFVIERATNLLESRGWMSLITPLSLVATGRFAPALGCLSGDRAFLSLLALSGDAHPSVLFAGVKMSYTIFCFSANSASPGIHTSKLYRWLADERIALFPLVQYQRALTNSSLGTLWKIGSRCGADVIQRISLKRTTIAQLERRAGAPVIYHRIVRHFVKSLVATPYFRNDRDGEKRSDDYKLVAFEDIETAKIVRAFLVSSTFYMFFIALSDAYHCGRDIVLGFPTDADKLSGKQRRALLTIGTRYEEDLFRNSARRRIRYRATGWIEYDEFYPRDSKPIADEIDVVLGEHYGFTPEELDFIINYDIKYRLGRSDEDDE